MGRVRCAAEFARSGDRIGQRDEAAEVMADQCERFYAECGEEGVEPVAEMAWPRA